MNHPIELKTIALTVRNSISPATARRGFLFVVFALVCFGLSPAARAADGDLGNANTAEGNSALAKLNGGTNNTAMGFQALFNNTTGSFNAATGDFALLNNTTGVGNTANGDSALFNNTTGGFNAAIGVDALFANTTGGANTATGTEALGSNTTGNNNTATGASALFGCGFEGCTSSTGSNNTATGASALGINNTGNNNTATGFNALGLNSSGNSNTAEGFQALACSTGSNNIALGSNAGSNLTTGNNNIDIGASGAPGESNTIRIGTVGVHKSAYIRGISGATVASGVTVIVDTKGHLGTVQSSAQFKDEIKPMDKASEVILALKPVTFRYKREIDPEGIPQFGLVAEQVEKVNPDLVARDAVGKVYTVRYEAVNAMLLNEFLKEHRKVQQLEATVAQQQKDFKATAVKQQKEITALTAGLKEQAAQIQNVSAQLKMSKFAPQMVANNQ